jgi:hypothetical protein
MTGASTGFETQSLRRQLGSGHGPGLSSSAHWHTFHPSKERPKRPDCPKTASAILHAEAPRLRIAQSGYLHVHWSRPPFPQTLPQVAHALPRIHRAVRHPLFQLITPPDSFIPVTITPFFLSFPFQSRKKVPLSSSYIFHTSHRPAQTQFPLLSVFAYQQPTRFHVLSYPWLKPVIVTAFLSSLRYGNGLLIGPCKEGRG